MSQLQTPSFSTKLFAGSITELLHPPAGQIPFLDGLRSFAILLVMSGHLSARFAAAHGSNFYSRLPFVQNGWIGVDLFFVLSGFFIGGQLWKELRDRKSISVGRFIIRRGFRIWPLYFFTFFCVLAFVFTVSHDALARQFGWTDLVFITNFYNRGIVEGSWSLCTEEQFYIVTPIALFLLARSMPLVRSHRSWLWGMLFAVPLLRAAVWIYCTGHFFGQDPALFSPIYYSSLTHCDGLIMGLIIANLWVAGDKPTTRFAHPAVLVALSVVIMGVLHLVQKEVFDFTVLALFFGSLVWLGLQKHPAIFNSKLFYWISRLSFGMYLNHEYMCPWIVNKLLPSLPLATRIPALTNLAGVVLLTLISAAISVGTFCLVEHPFLEMRKVVLGSRR
jgi:peptidoglycan/LPS O-acetylase OafA/YrhL